MLGAKYALELDGGGSSTVIVRINDELTLRNKPSDGSMRAVSNAILLVEKAEEEDVEDTPGDNTDVNNPSSGDVSTDVPNPPVNNTDTPAIVDDKKGGPLAQFFSNLWRAIVNFFKNLFG